MGLKGLCFSLDKLKQAWDIMRVLRMGFLAREHNAGTFMGSVLDRGLHGDLEGSGSSCNLLRINAVHDTYLYPFLRPHSRIDTHTCVWK